MRVICLKEWGWAGQALSKLVVSWSLEPSRSSLADQMELDLPHFWLLFAHRGLLNVVAAFANQMNLVRSPVLWAKRERERSVEASTLHSLYSLVDPLPLLTKLSIPSAPFRSVQSGLLVTGCGHFLLSLSLSTGGGRQWQGGPEN